MKTYKLQLINSLLLCFVSLGLNAQDLYLVIGQSNASGRATNFDHGGNDSVTNNVKYFTTNTFSKAIQPLNEYSGNRKSIGLQGVNFGLEFGKQMYEYNGSKVNLVVNARGGTKIEQWRKNSPTGYFSNTIQRVKAAEVECGCILKGVLWHQGESNVTSEGSYTPSYFTSLKALIQEFRDELGNVPFIVGQVYQNDKNKKFNNDLRKVDDSNFGIDNVDWVTAKKLTTFDGTHFDAASTRKLGSRYAKIMRSYINNSPLKLKDEYDALINGNVFVNVYPNPIEDIIHVKLNIKATKEHVLIEVIQMNGKSEVFFDGELTKGIQTIILDKNQFKLQPGVYLLRITTNEKTSIQKVVFE